MCSPAPARRPTQDSPGTASAKPDWIVGTEFPDPGIKFLLYTNLSLFSSYNTSK